jgi:hypothetical protein
MGPRSFNHGKSLDSASDQVHRVRSYASGLPIRLGGWPWPIKGRAIQIDDDRDSLFLFGYGQINNLAQCE